jgi:acetyl-CoA C-acetyltransferase
MQEVWIVGAARTPIGSFLGELAPLRAPGLAAVAIRAALERAALGDQLPEQVLLGCVLQAGLGQAPARQAAAAAGLPSSVGATTLNKVCGSGLRAVMDAANGILAGEWQRVVAGGMESMSNAPHLLQTGRQGVRMGAASLEDSMLCDGLLDASSQRSMGLCAEACAKKYQLSRAQQDDFARTSYQRALAADAAGLFAPELCAVAVPQRRAPDRQMDRDEEPHRAQLAKLTQLRPAFDPEGTITAANASKLSDGAAALVLMGSDLAKAEAKAPLARILAYASCAIDPEWFSIAPAKAIEKACARAGVRPAQVDVWEINEAFSVVTLAAILELQLDPAAVNPRGGAIALGHPLGASGARLLVTLVHTLQQTHKRYGCVALCIGGGEAVAMLIENPSCTP